jgi:serine/threonine protein kinase
MEQKLLLKGYQVSKKIDTQGFKSIYKGRHIATGQECLLVVMPVRQGPVLEHMMKRAKLLQKFEYPGLVTPIDYGIIYSEYFYYSIPAVPSLLIADVLEPIVNPKVYYFTLVDYFIKLLEIVKYIHSGGTTHRDIRIDRKGNVYLEGVLNPRTRVESRNLAKIVYLPYVSPEQLMGGAADAKTDIYSLGVVFYELITGRLPYESNYAKIDAMQKGRMPDITEFRDDIPVELIATSVKSLCQRQFRYANVQEWIDDLYKFYQQRPMMAKVKDFSTSVKQLFSFHSH